MRVKHSSTKCRRVALLYSLQLQLRPDMLDSALYVFKLEPETTFLRALAYTDDVTVTLTCPADIPRVYQFYAPLNQALVLCWKDISPKWYPSELGISIRYVYPTTPLSKPLNRKHLTLIVKSVTWYVFSWNKTPYTNQLRSYFPVIQDVVPTQIVPVLSDARKRINTVISWFLRRRAISRVPLITLHLDYMARVSDWLMFDLNSALFISRCHSQLRIKNSVTAEWFHIWLRFYSGKSHKYVLFASATST
jgi:hypothetical protein